MLTTIRLVISCWLLFTAGMMVTSGILETKFRFWEVAIWEWAVVLTTLYATWNNLRLDWILFRPRHVAVRVPPTSSVHFVSLALLPAIAYCCANLKIYYDSHLSMYDVSVRLPMWLTQAHKQWQSDLRLGTTELDVYLVLTYIIVFSASLGVFNLGVYSQTKPSSQQFKIPSLLVYSRIAVALVGLLVAALVAGGVFEAAFYYYNESKKYPELLSLSNIGPLFFDGGSVVMFSIYFFWLVVDAIHLGKRGAKTNLG